MYTGCAFECDRDSGTLEMNQVAFPKSMVAGRPGSSEVPRDPLTRWDASSTPANGIFLTKILKNKNKNAQRVENDLIVSTQNSTSRSTRERNG